MLHGARWLEEHGTLPGRVEHHAGGVEGVGVLVARLGIGGDLLERDPRGRARQGWITRQEAPHDGVVVAGTVVGELRFRVVLLVREQVPRGRCRVAERSPGAVEHRVLASVRRVDGPLNQRARVIRHQRVGTDLVRVVVLAGLGRGGARIECGAESISLSTEATLRPPAKKWRVCLLAVPTVIVS